MLYYITLLQTRSHAFILEQNLKNAGIRCEITYVPRQLSKELCSMGVKFPQTEYEKAAAVIKSSGLPGYRVFLETTASEGYLYTEVII